MALAEFPEKLQFLFEPARYKVAWGGRGSAKSWSFARALLIKGMGSPLRILCGRELMSSISDSVHKLLAEQIELMGFSSFYKVMQSTITGLNGTEFIFSGLHHNAAHIKSFESCDIAWVEEAQGVSKASWEVLVPTIRKAGSEIWVTFNPDLESDATYQRFIVKPQPDSIVAKVNYVDNPWFPEVLRLEMEHLRETDPDAYQHVWEGCCISFLDGAIYAKELRAVDREQRITQVHYDRARPVHTAWDIGYADHTAIWFVQAAPFEYRIIDYLEGWGESLQYYLRELQGRGYVYGTDYMPWDAHPRTMATGKSIAEMMRQAGRRVQIVGQMPVANGILAARAVFPICWFDAEKTADGLQRLRRYRYGESRQGQATRDPLHDDASHAADAWRTFAIGIKQPRTEQAMKAVARRPAVTQSAWS